MGYRRPRRLVRSYRPGTDPLHLDPGALFFLALACSVTIAVIVLSAII